ncbi:MAG: glycosyltransferase involved in cell wall biosynthesis [Myxococcota bacterium]|jgi:glycosyltransferase involved in cell wall biosynthesis
MLRVLQVDTAEEWRGGQVQTLYLARGMKAAGWPVVVACPQSGRLWRELEGIADERLAIPPGRTVRCAMVARSARPDLIAAQTSHAHTCCAPLSIPLVVHRRVDFVPSGGWKYRRPERYIAVSAAVARILSGVGAPQSVVVHDGVAALAVMPPAVDGPTVLAVGARVPHKGHAVLAEAARMLDGVDIGVAGDGPLVYPGLRWLGQRSDVPALLAAASVFVHPSVEEGMGQAVVEAMHAGLPIVASDAGGLPEVIGDTGILVPRGDAVALAEGIRRALAGDHPPVAAAQQRAAEQFSIEAMVAGTLAAYRDAVS